MNVALCLNCPKFTCLPEPGEHHQSGIIIAPTLDYMDRGVSGRQARWLVQEADRRDADSLDR
jgi:hypothetical protein